MMARRRDMALTGWMWTVMAAMVMAGLAAAPAPAQNSVGEAVPAELAELAPAAEAPADRAGGADADGDGDGDGDAAVDGEALDEIDVEKIAAGFRVVPASFQANSYVHFDDEGQVRNEQHNLSLNLNVFFDAEVNPRSYRNVQIDRIVTAADERLEAQHHHRNEAMIHHHQHGQQPPRFNIGFQLPHPQLSTDRIRTLRGSMEVVVGVGPERHAVLGPVAKILGKRVRVAEFPNSSLTVTRDEHNRMRLEMNGELMSLLSNVRFYTADGKEMPAQAQGSGSSGNTHYRYYQFNLPDDGRIAMTFLSGTRTVEVPFELEDLRLPVPHQEGDAELVIHAEPGDPMARVGGEGNGPGEGDLELRIE